MGFWGETFSFDGTTCSAHNLMLYDVGSDAQGATQFASPVTVIEEYIPSRWKPLFIGTKQASKLEFTIVFGANQDRIDAGAHLSRSEMDSVAQWLCGHGEYKYLEISQADMSGFRYKCIITGLQMIEYGMLPWAFRATVTCDGPYAYRYPHTYSYSIDGSTAVTLYNSSSLHGYYKPKLSWVTSSGGDVEIVNQSDNGRTFAFSGVPTSVTTIDVDNENCLITNSADLNLYKYFNYNFLRLVPGANVLEVTGTGTLQITCEFPVDVGG